MTEGRGCRAMAKKRGCVVEVYHAAAPRNDRERCREMTKGDDASQWYTIADILSSLRTSWQIHRR